MELEPGIRVVHIVAGPVAPVDKEDLPPLLAEFALRTQAWINREGEHYDLLHAHYWRSGVVAHRLKHEMSLPLVATFHTLDLVKSAAGIDDGDGDRAEAERSIIACADLVVASTRDEEHALITNYGADPARVEIIAPGVDHSVFHPGSRLAAKARLGLGVRRVVLFAGRIQPLKGGELAIRSFGALTDRDALLLVVGDPSGAHGAQELQRLRVLVRELGLDARVRFMGSVEHEELADYYRAAEVCVVPSHSESFGLVALEASSCATPVVAASVGGLRSIVDDGRTGFLIDSRSPSEFAAAIDKILCDPDLGAELGVNAVLRSERFSWNATAVRLRRAYGDLAVREPVQCR